MAHFGKIERPTRPDNSGAAIVKMSFEPTVARRGHPIFVKISIRSEGGELESRGIYIDLRGIEKIFIDDQTSINAEGDAEGAVQLEHQTYRGEFKVADAFILGPNESQDFEFQFQIPRDISPTYSGKYARHEIGLRGRMETLGSDPDAGFINITVT